MRSVQVPLSIRGSEVYAKNPDGSETYIGELHELFRQIQDAMPDREPTFGELNHRQNWEHSGTP